MDLLFEHLCVELNETRSRIDGIEELSNWLRDELYKKEDEMSNLQLKGTRKKSYTFEKDNISINDHFFINNLIVKVDFVFGDENNYFGYGKYQEKGKSNFFKLLIFGNKFNVNIIINEKGRIPERMIKSTLVEFEHEMLHAYSDYMIRKNSGENNSIWDVMDKTNYNRKSNFDNKDVYRKQTRQFLYAMDNFERSAYIAQTRKELIDILHINDDKPKVISSTMLNNAIKNTTTWSNYIVLRDFVKEMKWLHEHKDPSLNSFIKAYNEVSTKKINTAASFINIINSLFLDFEKKYLYSVGKIAYDIKFGEEMKLSKNKDGKKRYIR